jgi:hypothetical protein
MRPGRKLPGRIVRPAEVAAPALENVSALQCFMAGVDPASLCVAACPDVIVSAQHAAYGMNPMQVQSQTTLWPQLQALQSAALNQYQSGGNFSFTVGGGSGSSANSSSSAGSTGAGPQLSGSFKSGSLIAVGTMSNGQLDPFSSQQVQSEETMLANARQLSYEDSLQNFMTLAQAGSPNGQIAASSYTDQQQFVGDNGMISASFDTSFSLSPASGGAQQSSSSTLMQPIVA